MGLYRALAALEMAAGERGAAADALRLAVKKIRPAAQAEFLWALAHLLIDGGADGRDEAAALIVQMRKSAGPSATTDYLQARLLMVEGKPAEAARLLERARPILGDAPEVGEQIDLGLGRCYEQLGEPARQKEAYDRLAGRGVKSLPALLGLAAAEASLGNVDAAIARYRDAAALPAAPPEATYALVRLLIARNRQRGSTDWEAVTAALTTPRRPARLGRRRPAPRRSPRRPGQAGRGAAGAGVGLCRRPGVQTAAPAAGPRRAAGPAKRTRSGARGCSTKPSGACGVLPELREALAGFWAGRPREEGRRRPGTARRGAGALDQ